MGRSALVLLSLCLLLVNCGKKSSTSGDSPSNNTPASTACTTCRIFVSSAQGTGLVGGSASADTYCNSDPSKPATGTYKAMLVDSSRRACSTANCGGGPSEHLDWVFKSNTSYTRADGTPITTTNSNGLPTIPLTNAIGASIVFFWNGLNTDFTSSANSCQTWTSNSSSDVGACWRSDQTTWGGIGAANSNCDQNAHLVCVEQ